jgi:hypothetical protein
VLPLALLWHGRNLHTIARVAGFLSPLREVEPRPDPVTQPDEFFYVRSFLLMRVAIGVLGVVLPLLLVFVDKLAFRGDPFPRGSLSAYYYSGMRDVFVGIMSATGVFLITYKMSERNLDNLASLFAGISAWVIALFPTGRPHGSAAALTPLQDLLGETTVKSIHFVASGVFIGLLALLSYYFGVREGARPRRPHTRSPTFWRWFHWSCTLAMVVAIVWIVVTQSVGRPHYAQLVGEWVAVWAFGASWLAKGAELELLFGRPRRPVDPA